MKETEQTTSQDACENGHSFLPLYVTNFLGTLNDNFLKTLAGFTVIGWIADEELKSIAMGRSCCPISSARRSPIA